MIGHFWQNETYILYFLPLTPIQKTFPRNWPFAT